MQKIIGLVHTRFSPTGGVENYINKLIPTLLERNWLIHYFTAKIQQPVSAGMIIHKIPVVRGTSVTRMLSFAYGARRAVQRAHLPMVMGFGRSIYQDIYRDGSGCFLDYEKHAGKRFNRLYRRSYLHLERKRYADTRLQRVITVSQMVKDQIQNRYHVPSEKMKVIYSGVDARRLNPELKKRKNEFKMQLKIPEEALTVLFVGNGFERKGLKLLIEAASYLPADLPFVVIIAGRDKRTDHFRNLAMNSGCLERFRFLGYQSQIGDLYGAADLFVLPSFFDPFANVVLEALYSGTPVITTAQVGASEFVRHGINGFILPRPKSDALAEAILEFYATDHKEKMSEEAHRAAAACRWDLHVDDMEGLFLEILEQHRRPQ